MINNGDLLRILSGVPESRPRLIDLAWLMVGEDGRLDMQKVPFYAKELKEAIDEAEAYSKTTQGAVECLREMGRSQS